MCFVGLKHLSLSVITVSVLYVMWHTAIAALHATACKKMTFIPTGLIRLYKGLITDINQQHLGASYLAPQTGWTHQHTEHVCFCPPLLLLKSDNSWAPLQCSPSSSGAAAELLPGSFSGQMSSAVLLLLLSASMQMGAVLLGRTLDPMKALMASYRSVTRVRAAELPD